MKSKLFSTGIYAAVLSIFVLGIFGDDVLAHQTAKHNSKLMSHKSQKHFAYDFYKTGGFSPVKGDEREIRSKTIKHIAWQWEHNPVSILNAMQVWSEDRSAALNKLKEGQANNKSAQKLYDVAAEKLPDFWNLVFYTAWSEADFSAFESNLAWQIKNDWDSLAKSQKAWSANPRQEIWAYYHLLWGQKDNPEALKIYRAWWSKDKDRVMSEVTKKLKK